MADQEKPKDVQLLKSTRISVFVDEALQDMLVVTYEFGVKIYKGILLEYTKRNLPHGVTNLHPAFNTTNTKPNPDDDVLYSVNQRFAYMDPNLSKPKNVRIPSKYKNNKMTVRLRPRQVLCSKCKGICNENSENVSKKRKSQESVQAPPSKRSANAPITRSVYSEQLSKKKTSEQKVQPVLIPKLSRLLPQEISNALNGNLENLNQSSDKSKKETVKMSSTTVTPTTTTTITTTTTTTTTTIKPKLEGEEDNKNNVVDESDKVDHSTQHSNSSNLPEVDTTVPVVLPVVTQDPEVPLKSVKRTLRKKRSIGSMEDLWDESVFEEGVNLRNNDGAVNNNGSTVTDHAHNNSNTCVSTRTIKISYGPQGEGTVLKIPAPIEKFNTSDDSEENINITNHNITKGIDNKAARKALKRARKKARQKRMLSGNSPSHINALSPRYSIGGGSPRYTIVGTSRHCIGNNSPRYVTSSTELHVPKRHKHKLKRKKKHRDDKDRKHKEEDVNPAEETGGKDQAVTQKLSINLKRLHSTTYASCQNTSDKGEENTSSSDEHSEQAPDFPPPNPPLILRVNAQTVSSALGADGGRLLVGDVVWGKIHGFPWWPGKVLTITSSGNQGPQAHVAWYGSSTSSLIQCDQLSPYLDNFKIRYNKKKRGAYKEAIRQATTEARENAEARLRKETPLVSSPSQSIMTVPPPALASPREIDVMS
ncbi:hypothetical protein ILUMI_12861 [Ignelater luminosus]|uniref:PWWP domain-containing protein n=1 Tax=Ignelater luminosus TaxID=2038154 RepID=A0A8K0D1Y9_IGNLU|nr:hypothetical protein ILUMI_12861 [Ignelater luminosus]